MRYCDLAALALKLLGLFLGAMLIAVTATGIVTGFYEMWDLRWMVGFIWGLLFVILVPYVFIVKADWLARKVLRVSEAPVDVSLTLSPAWYAIGLVLIGVINILRNLQFFIGQISMHFAMKHIDPSEIPGYVPWYDASNLVAEGLQTLLAILLIAFAGRLGTLFYNFHSRNLPAPKTANEPSA